MSYWSSSIKRAEKILANARVAFLTPILAARAQKILDFRVYKFIEGSRNFKNQINNLKNQLISLRIQQLRKQFENKKIIQEIYDLLKSARNIVQKILNKSLIMEKI